MKSSSGNITTTSDRLTTVLSYGALLLLGYLVFEIFAPFLVPLAWSAVLAIFFYPMHQRVLKRLTKTPAALVSTAAVTMLLIVPALIVLVYTTKQAIDATSRLQSAVLDPNAAFVAHAQEWIRQHLPESLQAADLTTTLKEAGAKAASFLAGKLGGLVKNLFAFFLDLFLVIFALFFTFRDGEAVLRAAKHLLPFDEEIQDDMIQESGELVFASVAVGLLVALVQGLLGGLAFALAGIHAAIFWSVIIAFFSLVPVVGSALIWVPAALWLGFSGHWGKGVMVFAICGGVSGIIDNILRPLLLRNRTRLNDLLLFVSILGGLQVFGLLGLVAGPTVVAAALGVFRVYMDHRDRELPPAHAKGT